MYMWMIKPSRIRYYGGIYRNLPATHIHSITATRLHRSPFPIPRSHAATPKTLRQAADLILDPVEHDGCDLEVILLDMQEVAVALDANVGELDPLGIAAGLLEELDQAVVVGGVHAGLAGELQKRHAVDLMQLAGGLLLEIAVAVGDGVVADGMVLEVC